jgi:hypothetical protein
MAYNFQTGKNKVQLLTEYESVTQKVLFGNAVIPHWCVEENMTSYLKIS